MTGHPLGQLKQKGSGDCTEISQLNNHMLGQKIKIFGLVSKTRKILTKNGDPMMFLSLGDSNKEIDTVIFPKTLASLEKKGISQLCNNKPFIMEGKLDMRNNNFQLICDNYYEIKET